MQRGRGSGAAGPLGGRLGLNQPGDLLDLLSALPGRGGAAPWCAASAVPSSPISNLPVMKPSPVSAN